MRELVFFIRFWIMQEKEGGINGGKWKGVCLEEKL